MRSSDTHVKYFEISILALYYHLIYSLCEYFFFLNLLKTFNLCIYLLFNGYSYFKVSYKNLALSNTFNTKSQDFFFRIYSKIYVAI